MSSKIRSLDFGQEKHVCSSEREGDWIIFKCPQCDYVRKMNYKTNEMKVSGGDMMTTHSGFHVPIGLQMGKMNMN
jgi:hypothetical protein